MPNEPSPATDRNDPAIGIAWLLTDMALVTGVNVLVKLQGQSLPALQLVFLRALIGLAVILPLVWVRRGQLRRMTSPWRNAGRVACNAAALSLTFYALTQLPLALVNAVGFTRPFIAMILAALLLGENIARRQWAGLALALCGVALIAAPGQTALGPVPVIGLGAAALAVLFGAMATVQTRALRHEGTMVMMLFYTAGLCLFTGGPALILWEPVAPGSYLPILAIGLLAQIAQLCFLRAYRAARASVLSPVSYASLLFATAAGWIVFGERPGLVFAAGGVLVIAGAALNLRRPGGRT
ncbi:DMT family transporter [Roseicyclus sp. F158]|uniref:DMT family transporter n=1 Tax=Tropicimonas omnivorans TaxID=3075590 RepID=A0ABU3DC37_9RHOB|nr:DMT family transporter [Roseicyclus sp. F158]MDT0681277.1 DMT family transporter [Roseicyclus sp. F158]